MFKLGREHREAVRQLCGDSKEVLVRGAAEGLMGDVWVPESESPSYCLIHQGDFAFLLGIPPKGSQSMDLRLQILESCGRDFINPSDERWELWLDENFQGECRRISRYSMKMDHNRFDEKLLKEYAGCVPEGIRIRPIDEKVYKLALKEEWSRDFCSNFDSAEDFLEHGLGFAAMEGKTLVSGCSAYGRSLGMLEVQVETRKEYRRKGLALACGAHFILSCMEQGIYPNWDAGNLGSVGLAEKLGYLLEREYSAYQLADEREAC